MAEKVPSVPERRITLSENILDQLERITGRLKRAARLVGFFTTGSFLWIVVLSTIHFFIPVSRSYFVSIVLVGLVFPAIAITRLLVFDSAKRTGDVLFKEISDEVQWYIRYSDERDPRSSPAPAPEFRPELRVRILLRNYASATALPLVSSASGGPALYAFLNIFLAVVALVLAAVLGQRF